MTSAQAQPVEPRHARLLAGVALLAAIASMAIWFSDRQQQLSTPWDIYAIPILAALYCSIGIVHLLAPQRMVLAIWTALLPTSLYLQGAMHLALAGPPSIQGLYAVTSIAQVMPVFYVIAFVALPRGGALMSWLHYAGLAAQCLLLNLLPQPASGWNEIELITQKTVQASVLIHPACILALSFIVHLRDRLNHSQREAFKSKERFLAMLSHEIRTPLQAMLGTIDLLGLKLRGGTEVRALDRLRTSATQLDRHLRDVTEFTRLEDPALRIHAETFDLVQLLNDVRDDWLTQAQAKGLSIRIDIPDEDRPTLQAMRLDPTRVRQIVCNLLSNALKYTLVGGVTVQASLPAHPRHHVLLVVSDSGIGIAAQHLDDIFQPYVRLEDARAMRVEGSGLGLAVVKRLVDRLGGRLQVSSHADQGSRFEVALPIMDNR
jgi:signal transduction histidine kinase